MDLLFWWVSEEIYRLFIRGCILGLASGAVLLMLVVFFRHKRLSMKPAGLIFSVAFLIGEAAVHPVPAGLWFAIFLVGISQEILRYAARLQILLLIAAAILIGFYSFQSRSLLFHSSFVSAGVSLSLAIGSYEKRHNPFIITFLLLLSVCSIFTTVPDIEEVALLIGILLFAAIAFSISPARSRNWLGILPLTIVLTWVVFMGGEGRPASIVTSIGCLGFLILEPVLQMITRFLNRPLTFSVISELAYHSLSITISLNFARTTSDIGQATIAAIAALGAPIIFILLAESLKRVRFLS